MITIKENFPWEKKVEMVGYANNDELDKLFDFLNKNMYDFDVQAWDMFITSLPLKEIENYPDDLQQLFLELSEGNLDEEIKKHEFPLRVLIRFSAFIAKMEELEEKS